MSYLAPLTSAVELGVVQIGDYIKVSEGIISLEQDLSAQADVTFNTVSADELYDNGLRAVTEVVATAGSGISVTAVTSTGPNTAFTVINTGVLSLTPGPGINLDTSTGDITISSYGADLINVVSVTEDYTATPDDEYIGVNSNKDITITLPAAVDGRVYVIKDEHGSGSGNIKIQPQSGEKIDNKSSYTIRTDYQSLQIVYRNKNWWIM